MNSIPALTRVWRAASVLLGMFLLFVEAGRAQLTETPVVGPEALPLAAAKWPIVSWGLAPAIDEQKGFDEPLSGTPILDEREKFGLTVPLLTVNQERKFGSADNGRGGRWLGPVETLAVPLPGARTNVTSASDETESEPEAPRTEFGDVSFNRAAARLAEISDITKPGDFPRQSETLEVQANDVAKPSDLPPQSETQAMQTSEGAKPGHLSRQLEAMVGDANLARALRISGWTIITIVGMAMIIALVSGYPRKGRRRHHSHQHQHHHHHHRRSHRHRRSRGEAY